MFSSTPSEDEPNSIFKEADFFSPDEKAAVSPVEPKFGQEMPYFDSNDTFNVMEALSPKDMANVPTGISTFGFSEYVMFLEDSFLDLWMACSQVGGLGLGWGLIMSALSTRAIFVPI